MSLEAEYLLFYINIAININFYQVEEDTLVSFCFKLDVK